MKQLLLMCAAVALVGCGENRAISEWKEEKEARVKAAADAKNPEPTPTVPEKFIADPILEKAILKELKKPEGELTKADLEKVTKLDLFGYRLTDVPKGLEKLTKLTHLRLDDNELTDVRGLEKLTNLKELTLGENQLTSVEGLENLTQLKELSLWRNKLTELPKGLEKLTQLTDLNIATNQLTDVKLLEKLTQLKTLNLGQNQLTELPKGLEKCTQLEYLLLGSNKLTSVKGLEKLTQLKGLFLPINPDLTRAQIDKLAKALPKCQITHNAKK